MNSALLVAYKRSDCISKIVKSLSEGNIKKLYVAIDGPKPGEKRNSEIETKLNEASQMYGIDIFIWTRKKNLGLAAAVITAVDWFFSLEEEGLILEDDLMFNSDFVNFVQIALDEIKNHKDCLMISGNQFSDEFEIQNQASITNYPMVWGWATTASKWAIMRDLILTENLDWSRFTDALSVRSYWAAGQFKSHKGYINSWAVPLAAAMRAENKTCLLPPINLVSNIGTDSSATHTMIQSANMHAKIDTLNFDINFDFGSKSLEINNSWLEKFHFGIRNRNIFSYLKALIISKLHTPALAPLTQRVKESELFS